MSLIGIKGENFFLWGEGKREKETEKIFGLGIEKNAEKVEMGREAGGGRRGAGR